MSRHAPCFLLFLAALAAPACIDAESEDDGLADGPATAETADDKSDTAEGVRTVRAGQLTVTINAVTTVGQAGGQPTLTIRGTTSRKIESVMSFVPDDPFGEARVTGPKSFETVLRNNEVRAILGGLPLLVQIHTETGTPRDYIARIDLAPRFARFSGSSKVFLDAVIDPVFAVDYGGSSDPLRYQATVTTTANATITATATDGAPEVWPLGPRSAHLEWKFDAFALALDPPTDAVVVTARFANGTTATKRAGIDVRVVGVGLTTDDPYEVWAAPTCTPDRLDCLLGLDESMHDLAACGSYRETQVCAAQHLCEIIGPQPLALNPIDAAGLETWRADFAAGCPSGGSWCHLDTIEVYALAACSTPPLSNVVDEYLETVQDAPFEGSEVATSALGGTVFFGTAYSPRGPALLSALHGWVGSAEPQTWVGVEEVSCHNCTNFVDRTILYYPSVGRVVVLTGGHGYDS